MVNGVGVWQESSAIPEWTRCAPGALTPSGLPATFRSSVHAWIALRLVYLADVDHAGPAKVAATERLYAARLTRFGRHCEEMVALAAAVDAGDIATSAALWAAVHQVEVDTAFSTVICERERHPGKKKSLASAAYEHFGLHDPVSVASELRDPRRVPGSQAAWVASGGMCQSCGTVTVADLQHKRLAKTFRANPDLFDLTPTYVQTNGVPAPLWLNRVLIAAKGVGDHVVAWSRGGRTDTANVANVCAGCNYSRNDSSLDRTGVAAYRPATTPGGV